MLLINILYQIFIAPIELVMKFILEYSFKITDSYGLSLVILGLIVNIALLPLYNLAESWQQDERDKFAKIKDKIVEIKEVFTGQERFMMLKTLYRQNGYHPLLAARNSLGFLIQIPFFFAAFHLLSNYEPLSGHGFLFFNDLSQPDQLFSIGGISINIMPFVMTVINLLSAYVYAAQLQKKDKIQLYVIAAVFLVALYVSPVALVFYWTINNLFSLVKNYIYKKYNILASNNSNEYQTDKTSQPYKTGLTAQPINAIPDSHKYPRFLGFLKAFNHKLFLHFAISAAVISVYSAILFNFVFPPGINKNFVQKTQLIFIGIAALNLFLHLILSKRLKNILPVTKASTPKFNASDWVLILLPLAPILHYVFLNKDLVDADTVYTFVTVLFLIAAITVFGITNALKRVVPASFILISTLVFVYILYTMPKIAALFNLYIESRVNRQLLLFLALMLTGFFFYSLKRSLLYVLVVSFFVIEVGSGIFGDPEDALDNANAVRSQIQEINFKNNNSVYFLTYDAYPNIETHEGYGIDNSEQINFLKEKGFAIYNGTYSIAGSTFYTLGSTLSIEAVKGIEAKDSINGYNISNKTLQKNGYKTYGVYPGTYYTTDKPPLLDYFYPAATEVKKVGLQNAILEGIFRFDIEFDNLSKTSFIKEKRRLITEDNKTFLQAHGDYPGHAQSSGKCMPNEQQMYEDRLKKGNLEMKQDVDLILEKNPNAIIIIAGDHGPYITKNCTRLSKGYSANEVERLDIQDRFGAFITIRWPDPDAIHKYQITSVQDIMPAVFAYLSDNDKLFDDLKIVSETFGHETRTAGVKVVDGIIHGGKLDGQPLFLNREIE